jgi:hypothetical protein
MTRKEVTAPVEPMTADELLEAIWSMGGDHSRQERSDMSNRASDAVRALLAVLRRQREVISAADAMRAQISDAWVHLPEGPLDTMLAYDDARAALGDK